MENTSTQDPATKIKLMALVVAETIREVRQVPSGHLYAMLMGKMSIATYEAIINTLINAKLVKRDGHHMLTWVGKF